MGWFGPSGDCGCCDTYVCDDHTCTTRTDGGTGEVIRTYDGVDMEPCECIDFDTGLMSDASFDYVVHLVGNAVGVSGTLPGGTAFSSTTADISGSYSFSYIAAVAGVLCGTTQTPSEYKLHSEFLGTSGGSDYWAIVWLRPFAVGNELICTIHAIGIGDPEPTTIGGSTGDTWDYDYLFQSPCGTTCVCSEWALRNDGFYNYDPDTTGESFDLSDCTATSEIV